MTHSSYRQIETAVLMWGDARQITTNGKALGQAKKTVEEANELYAACMALSVLTPGSEAWKHELAKARDGLGDVLVTLVMCAERLTRETGTLVDVIDCFREAYEEIKDRRGHLTPEGVFVKEE